jgi:hypothetical protein
MPCTTGTFSGAWGDPFSPDSLATPAVLTRQNVKAAGAETVSGFATKIYQIEQPAKIKLWVDGKCGLVVKMQMTPAGAPPQIVSEVKQLSLAAPPASTFVLPPDCDATAAAQRRISPTPRMVQARTTPVPFYTASSKGDRWS